MRATRESGYFRVERHDGVWWLIDPSGARFLSIGVNGVNRGWDPRPPRYDAARRFSSTIAWERDVVFKLRRWGFNTLGAWADPELIRRAGLPYAVLLGLGPQLHLPWTDFWSKDIEERARELARVWTKEYRDDPLLLGYFVGNDFPWWDENLFWHFLGRPWREKVAAAGRLRWVINKTKLLLVELLERHYRGRLDALNSDWEIPAVGERIEYSRRGKRLMVRWKQRVQSFRDLKNPVSLRRRLGRRPKVIDLFLTKLYARYWELISRAVRSADPNHLVLGERSFDFYMPHQLRVAGRWADVISVNMSTRHPDGWISPNHLSAIQRLSGRPALISEFYCCAMENASGCLNAKEPRFLTVVSQRERAQAYGAQVRHMASMPHVVGYHWYQYYDQSPSGSATGEDYNMGLVDIQNREYRKMTRASIQVNAEAWTLHARSRRIRRPRRDDRLAFKVPRASRAPALDGGLQGWDKLATWLPGLSAAPRGVPLGDVFVSWTPEGLHVAAQYQSLYRAPWLAQERAVGAPWPEKEGDRVMLALAHVDHTLIRKITWGIFPEDWRWVLLRDSGGQPAHWFPGLDALFRGFECTIPIPPVRELLFAAVIRLRGDAEVIYWGTRPLSVNHHPKTWGRLKLC